MNIGRLPALLLLVSAVLPQPDAHAQSPSALNEVCLEAQRTASEESDTICRRVSFDLSKLARGSPEHIESILNLGNIQALEDSYIDAAPFYTEALSLVDARDPHSLESARILVLLGDAKLRYSKFADAEVLIRRALSIFDRQGVGRSIEAANARVLHGDLLAVLGDFPAAQIAFIRSRDDLLTTATSDKASYLNAQLHLAQMYEVQHRFEQSRAEFEQLLIASSEEPKDPAMIIRCHEDLGWVVSQLGDRDDAVAHYRVVLDKLRASSDNAIAVSSIEQRIEQLVEQGTAP